jgi:hypothetical protein
VCAGAAIPDAGKTARDFIVYENELPSSAARPPAGKMAYNLLASTYNMEQLIILDNYISIGNRMTPALSSTRIIAAASIKMPSAQ